MCPYYERYKLLLYQYIYIFYFFRSCLSFLWQYQSSNKEKFWCIQFYTYFSQIGCFQDWPLRYLCTFVFVFIIIFVYIRICFHHVSLILCRCVALNKNYHIKMYNNIIVFFLFLQSFLVIKMKFLTSFKIYFLSECSLFESYIRNHRALFHVTYSKK